MDPTGEWDHTVDVLVAGSGLGGLTAAVSAWELGCREALVVEKGARIGGTSALSGGVIWIPCNRYARALGQPDSLEEAQGYLHRTIPEDIRRDDMIAAYLESGPEMVDFLVERTDARYVSLSRYPDYHSHVAGAKLGDRALEPEPLDSRALGENDALVHHSHRLWYLLGVIPLTLTELAAIQVKLPGWTWQVARNVLRYALDLRWRLRSRFDRIRKVGSAGVGRLVLWLARRQVPIWTGAALQELVRRDGRVVGAIVARDGRRLRIGARKGVVLAAGGFEHDQAMRERYLPKPTDARWSAAIVTNTGDAINAARAVGAKLDLMHRAWWCMTAQVPGEERPRLMIIEKALPGCCLVNRNGRRFLNESQNYQSLVERLYEAHTPADPCVPVYLVFDARYRRRYICGPLLTPKLYPDWLLPRRWFDEGFIARAPTLERLASAMGIDAPNLAATVERHNAYASTGKDLEFGRGDAVYDRHYGDPGVKPNPNLAPIAEAPFYAMKLAPGDIGTQGGMVIDPHARVLDEHDRPIPGLYATGNCTSAIIPTYPGPGATLGPAMVFGYRAARHMAGL